MFFSTSIQVKLALALKKVIQNRKEIKTTILKFGDFCNFFVLEKKNDFFQRLIDELPKARRSINLYQFLSQSKATGMSTLNSVFFYLFPNGIAIAIHCSYM